MNSFTNNREARASNARSAPIVNEEYINTNLKKFPYQTFLAESRHVETSKVEVLITKLKMWTLFTLLLITGEISGVASNFECYPNQTIRFSNPDSSLYTHFKAFYDDGEEKGCSVITDSGKTNAYLNCASTTASVTLYISDRNLTSGDNILSKNSQTYSFLCNEVGSHNRTLTNALNVNITETADSDTPEFNITSAFFDSSSNIITAATVGDTVYYIIKGPSEYDLRPLQCNATGRGANEHTILIANGCSQDTDLILDFEKSKQGLENHYNASLYVFKFYNSDTLTVTCTVEVCSGSESCNFTCGSQRRRRHVTITSLIKREADDDVKMSTVGNSLRILDAPLGGSRRISGSMEFLSTALVFLTALLV